MASTNDESGWVYAVTPVEVLDWAVARNQEYWKAAVAYHTRELAEQRRQLKRARAKLAQAEKEETELKETQKVVY